MLYFIFAQFLIILIFTGVSGCISQNNEIPTKTEQTDIASGSAITTQHTPKQSEPESVKIPVPEEDSIPDQDPSETFSEILDRLDALDKLIDNNS